MCRHRKSAHPRGRRRCWNSSRCLRRPFGCNDGRGSTRAARPPRLATAFVPAPWELQNLVREHFPANRPSHEVLAFGPLRNRVSSRASRRRPGRPSHGTAVDRGPRCGRGEARLGGSRERDVSRRRHSIPTATRWWCTSMPLRRTPVTVPVQARPCARGVGLDALPRLPGSTCATGDRMRPHQRPSRLFALPAERRDEPSSPAGRGSAGVPPRRARG